MNAARTAKTVNPYKSIAKKTRFRKLPIVEQEGSELMMLGKGKGFYEMLVMSRGGSCTMSRVYKDGRRENVGGLWELMKQRSDGVIRVMNVLDSGERVRLCVSDSNVRVLRSI